MKPRLRSANFRARLYVVAGVLALAATSLVVRAVDLQLLDKAFYQAQGNERFLREIPIPTSRGTIFDRNGEPLAVSSPVESIWADPQQLLQHPQRLPELAEALGIPLDTMTQRLAQRAEREFVYLRRQLPPEAAEAIIALGIPGVNTQREFRRFYPLGEAMAHVLGFANIDERGQEGLELAFDEWLSGQPGAKRVIRDRLGNVVENVDLVRAAEPGRDLTLSIDRRIQYLAHRELKSALLEYQAAAGSAVVLDVETGEILAMVNQPSWNPNARDVESAAARRNRAVTDVFEPGSVIKAFSVAAALETGRFTPASTIDTSPGSMGLPGGYRIHDIRNYGVVDLTRLLTKSSNVGAAKLTWDMDPAHLHDLLARFGFGQTTGSGFPGESPGVLADARAWGPVEKATISYGYGLSVTTLQLAQAYAALGNGGRLMPPTFVKGVRNPARTVVDPQIASTLLDMLETVTGPEGTAQRANVRGYRVAGKTGTSRKIGAAGYERRYVSVFAGLVPASAPRFAMVVVVDDPRGKDYYAGIIAAPAFSRVMDGALRLMDVPPDEPETWLVELPAPSTPAPGALPPEAEAVPDTLLGAALP